MDKVTQAMLACKAESLGLKEEGGIFLSNQEEKTHSKISVDEMEARRLRQQKEIAISHQQRKDKREEVRAEIRNKYRLKGSPEYSGSYYTKRKWNDTGQSNSGDGEQELRTGFSKKCSVQ